MNNTDYYQIAVCQDERIESGLVYRKQPKGTIDVWYVSFAKGKAVDGQIIGRVMNELTAEFIANKWCEEQAKRTGEDLPYSFVPVSRADHYMTYMLLVKYFDDLSRLYCRNSCFITGDFPTN